MHEGQPAVDDRDVGARRDDVHVVRLYDFAVDGFADRHDGRLRQRFAKEARMRGIQMLDQDERHSDVGGQMFEQLREDFESSGGRPYPDDGKRVIRNTADARRGDLPAGDGAPPPAQRPGSVPERFPRTWVCHVEAFREIAHPRRKADVASSPTARRPKTLRFDALARRRAV
jgi:hypothetical protein